MANVGDSRAVLSRAGTAVDLSVDHKPEDDEEKRRIIKVSSLSSLTLKAGGEISEDGRVNGGLNLSRALGDHAYKKTPGSCMLWAICVFRFAFGRTDDLSFSRSEGGDIDA